MRFVFLLGLLSIFNLSYGQSDSDSIPGKRYFEDQFYLGLTYNFMLNNAEGTNQRNFSYGLLGGIIKDIPLNASRTRAIGIGVGLALNSYYSNLVANQIGGDIVYSVQDTIKRSKLETHLLEFPLEFRWRNSTVDDYKFWRLYAGVKAAYVLGARSKFVSNIMKDGFYNTDLGKFQYGITLSFGYNTFNFHAYYALSHLFDGKAAVNGEILQYKPLRVGLIFYIL
ncbi:porin family protein [Maribacter sp. X9]|uniref:porin family protein n=1 Tax=Maribacter sp. X9 TaxID=3402159 RepID=UPI003AF3D8DE